MTERDLGDEAFDIVAGRIYVNDDTNVLDDEDAKLVARLWRASPYADKDFLILIGRLQRALGIMPDGVLGPNTNVHYTLHKIAGDITVGPKLQQIIASYQATVKPRKPLNRHTNEIDTMANGDYVSVGKLRRGGL